MARELVPTISMSRSANYVTQAKLWGGPQFTRMAKHKQQRYARPASCDSKSETFKNLILKALLA